jgi:hypothetical protein
LHATAQPFAAPHSGQAEAGNGSGAGVIRFSDPTRKRRNDTVVAGR